MGGSCKQLFFFAFLTSFPFFLCANCAPPTVLIPFDDYIVHIKGTYAAEKKAVQYIGLKYANAERFMPSQVFLNISAASSFNRRSNRTDANSTSNANIVYVQATQKAPACAQNCPKGTLDCMGSEMQKEDCLTLDISVPAPVTSHPSLHNNTIKYTNSQSITYPVIVFFHGGAMRFGNINEVYSGDIWASRSSVIIVTVGYRLGMLGWLRYADAFNGNQGFTDQINALIWVNHFIKYFGGDKDRIAIAGHSAGAVCVTCHMISPYSRGLFQRAIIMSGSIGDPRKTVAQSELIGRQALSESHLVGLCGSPPTKGKMTSQYIHCLQQKTTTADILRASEQAAKTAFEIDLFFALHNWEITVDGDLVPEDCTAAILQGRSHPGVQVIIGSTNTEGVFVHHLKIANILATPIAYTAALSYFFGQRAVNLLKIYPPVEADSAAGRLFVSAASTVSSLLGFGALQASTASSSMQYVFGHYVYNCAKRRMARALRQFNKDVYVYSVNEGYDWTKFIQTRKMCPADDKLCELTVQWCAARDTVCHAEDMPVLFQRSPLQQNFQFSEDEKQAAQIMYDYYGSFARDGMPLSTHPNASKWEVYDPAIDNWQLLGLKDAKSAYNVLKVECDMWDSIIPDYNLTWMQYRSRPQQSSREVV